MAEGKWISYLRVSTDRQGRSGLGLEAQRAAVDDFLNGGRWRLIKEYVEVESSKRSDRPKLAEAVQACRAHGAKLVIAKLDRLSRDAHFLLGLEKAGVDFLAADMPNANRLTVGIMAMVAEEERRMISKRTKDGLAAAKRHGVKLGGRRRKIIGEDAKGKPIYGKVANGSDAALPALCASHRNAPKVVRLISPLPSKRFRLPAQRACAPSHKDLPHRASRPRAVKASGPQRR
jgi:DNA invertase Pin-like site-specific DNA recombinase